MPPISQLAVNFAKLPEAVSLNNLKKVAKIAGEVIRSDMARRAPKDKGVLAEDIMMAIERGATVDQVVVKVGPSKKTAWRAKFIENGVRPHIIKAKKAHVLYDMGSGAVYGVGAKHPGIKAHPFIRPALDENAEEAGRIFAEALDQMIRKAFA